jgi:hypothetical protein
MADAQWLAGDGPSAFAAFRRLARRLAGDERRRVIEKARRLYRARAGWFGRALAAWPWAFGLALRNGWLRIR